jgi:hypothetical protein
VTDGWTEKERQQFARIRDGFLKTGFSPEDAEEHARRTLEQARIRPRRPAPDPQNPTKDDLYQLAKRYDIAGRSQMDKEELERAVFARQRAWGGDDGT